MTYREPVDMLLEPGDLLTISWSGELRTVIVAMDKEGDLILRDLTDAESAALVEREGEAGDGSREDGAAGDHPS
jgi:hypothetical protein